MNSIIDHAQRRDNRILLLAGLGIALAAAGIGLGVQAIADSTSRNDARCIEAFARDYRIPAHTMMLDPAYLDAYVEAVTHCSAGSP